MPAAPVSRVGAPYARWRTAAQTLVAVAICVVGLSRSAGSQQVDTGRGTPYRPDALSTGQFASRSSLQQLAVAGGSAATVARDRLANGDFLVGDRIAVAVQGEPTLTDTFTVREGQLLRLPNMNDVPLHGVLHSELQANLTHELTRILRDPVVRATPLVRVAVLGQVSRPGYYSAPADELVSDMLMRAGGPTSNAEINKTVVRRGPEIVFTAKEIQTAMAQGETIDQLDLRPGDQIVVGERPAGGAALRVLGVAALVAGIGTSIALIVRH